MLHAIDSLHLAGELNKRCEQAAKVMPILLEVNVSGEGSKHGFLPEAAAEAVEAFPNFPQLELHGLMTMAPFTRQPESTRPFFRKLAETRTACEDILGAPLPELSMGMSSDFEVAVEEGLARRWDGRVGLAAVQARSPAKAGSVVGARSRVVLREIDLAKDAAASHGALTIDNVVSLMEVEPAVRVYIDVDVRGVPRPPTGDYGDVVEPIGSTTRFTKADLDI